MNLSHLATRAMARVTNDQNVISRVKELHVATFVKMIHIYAADLKQHPRDQATAILNETENATCIQQQLIIQQ